MKKLLKEIWIRIKTDWVEWVEYRKSVYNVRRDNKAIKRAIQRAIEKNFTDGKTYYIMKDCLGGINELNSDQLLWFTRKGLFTRDQYDNRFKHAIDIITSNKHIRDQYYKIHHTNEEANE